jgi:hypothetical protein
MEPFQSNPFAQAFYLAFPLTGKDSRPSESQSRTQDGTGIGSRRTSQTLLGIVKEIDTREYRGPSRLSAMPPAT